MAQMALDEARATIHAALYAIRFLVDDLPDGMADEMREAIEDYRDGNGKVQVSTELAETLREIALDWGFPL